MTLHAESPVQSPNHSENAKPGAALPRGVEQPIPSAAVLREIGLERTIGSSDFQDIAFFELDF